MPPVSGFRGVYHRAVPERIRNPIGMARRRLQDRMTRALSPVPLPPVELLANIQLTPFVSEYLTVGGRAADGIRSALQRAGVRAQADVLDFGCGSARTLRHFTRAEWTLHGCDVDEAALEWARRALPGVDLRLNETSPPLPWADGSFDAVWAVSVFTHFDERAQREWFGELARVLRPGGIAAVSTMGESVIEAFRDHDTPSNRAVLREYGVIYLPRPGSFNDQAAFHTSWGIAAMAAPHFVQEEWLERGLDGFQDLSVLRRAG